MNEQEQAIYDKILSNIDKELEPVNITQIRSYDGLRALFEGMRLFTDSVAMRIQSDNLSKTLEKANQESK